MSPSAPRVAMVVNNAVDGDSRVQKVAWSMAARGYDVTLVGVQPPGETSSAQMRLGHARVLLVARAGVLVGPAVRDDAARRAALARLRRWDALEVRSRAHVGRGRAAARRLSADWATALEDHRGLGVLVERVAATPVGRGAVVGAGLVDPDGGWRQLNPHVQDVELAVAPVLDDLAPDLVHAHDFHTVGIAARTVARAAARGRHVRWVYDAHEYLAGARGDGLRGRLRHRFFLGLEREYAPLADAVVTVSEPIADLLEHDLRLRRRPEVVLNVPPATSSAPDVPVRTAAGVDEGTPLLVYTGSCAPQRGVATVVEALAHLPGAVLALVAPARDRHVEELLALATRTGVGGRVRTVPFVRPDAVPAYLSGADVGLSPLLHRPNHELSLSTKYAEYVHAGLPVVTSDVRTMAAFTRRHGNGEVFPAGDARALADAVRRVLEDPARYRAAYRDGSLARAMSWEAQEEALVGLYERLTGVRPDPHPDRGPLVLRPVP